jgi:outer membrane receptor for ferrienterochelin and colicins
MKAVMRHAIVACAVALSGHVPSVLAAQVRDTVVVRVRVTSDSAPLPSVMVRAGRASAETDSAGTVALRLGPGSHVIVAARIGFYPDSASLVARADTSLELRLMRREEALEAMIVSATRTERRIEQTPLRVEVLAREEVEEKMLMTPGDITMMLNETGGLRVQTTSPSLGGANVRVHGLRGRYTLMLSDGLPLFGGQSGTLGLLQIPPMDLRQVEVIKGVASALYGSSALGGVVNLVSRLPEEEPEGELLLNQTTRNGSDGVLWASRKFSDTWGYTLLASGHRQARVDVDADGWTDIPGYGRGVVRPRLFWNGREGQSLMMTAGATLEDRRGGTLGASLAPDGAPYAEQLRTRRFDGGAIGRLPLSLGVLSIRGSASAQRHGHRFGNVAEDDEHATWFTEASLASTRGRHTTVFGAAFQRESYTSDQVSRFNYGYHIPAVFGQYDVDVAEGLSASVSGRGDFHSEYGSYFNPRLSLLLRIVEGWTVRASAGTGAFSPTPFTEETEATGLTPLSAVGRLGTERARSASVDVGGAFGPFEVNATAFGSRIAHPLAVRRNASDPARLEIFNAADPTVTSGADGMLRYRFRETTTTASYTFVNSREQDPEGTATRTVPLTPRHTAGLVSVWEREDVGRVGLEFYYTGRQPLDENPYLSESRSYSVFGAIAERHVGRHRVFLNLENLGNVRLTNYQRLVRPTRGEGGRWTTDAWAPLDGRVINGGVRLDLGRSRPD